MKTFALSKIWNESVITTDREPVPRETVWASELGKPLIDIYLAMLGTPSSNPPNFRSRQKFYAGHVWEFIAGLVLNSMGVIQDRQQVIKVEDCAVPVKGKLDYILGGIPDYDKARNLIRSYPFAKEMNDRFMLVIDRFEQAIGKEEIYPMVHEVKSCSEYVLEKIQKGGRISGHDLQIYHYLRGLKMRFGVIDYISKNDSLMEERLIDAEEVPLQMEYENKLSHLKGYLDADEMPPPAPEIVFEEKFQKNFSIEYSGFLTMIYGYKTPEEYREKVDSKISRWNRVLKRIKDIETGATTKTGKPILLTDKNKLAIEEMNKENWDAYSLAKVAQVEEEIAE